MAVLVHRALFQEAVLYMRLAVAVLLEIRALFLEEILVRQVFLVQVAHQVQVVSAVHVIMHVMRLEQMALHQDLAVVVAQPMVVQAVTVHLVSQFLAVRFEQVAAH
jgi:hypothetical protein